MKDLSVIDAAGRPLTAIKIDPDTCRVELIQVQADEVALVLRSALTTTVEFKRGNCLVIDDGSFTAAHPSRFRFKDDAIKRPYFGPVLVLGLLHGNWASTTLPVKGVRRNIRWEQWDVARKGYGKPTLELA